MECLVAGNTLHGLRQRVSETITDEIFQTSIVVKDTKHKNTVTKHVPIKSNNSVKVKRDL